MPRKIEVEPGVERMALIVIQQEVAAGGGEKSVRPPDTSPEPRAWARRRRGRPLRGGTAAANARPLPSRKTRVVNRQREEHVGVSDGVVIEVVSGPLMVVVDIQRPAAHRDRQAEQVLLVPLALQRMKPNPWTPRNRGAARSPWRAAAPDSRGPGAPQHPVQSGNADRPAQRDWRVFRNRSGEMRQAHAAVRVSHESALYWSSKNSASR